jgi:hypothetical protein
VANPKIIWDPLQNIRLAKHPEHYGMLYPWQANTLHYVYLPLGDCIMSSGKLQSGLARGIGLGWSRAEWDQGVGLRV